MLRSWCFTGIAMSGLLSLLTGCIYTPDADTDGLLYSDHQLVDRIWEVKSASFIEKERFINRIIEADYLLLGELHDNHVHHRHQAWVIKQLAMAGRDAGIAYEMIYKEQGKRLAGLEINSASELIEILNQTQTGWDYENQYRPLFVETIAAGYPIVAANLDRKKLMEVLKQGEGRLPADYRRILDNTPFNDAQRKDLLDEIHTSHCNMLDSQTGIMMLQGQRIRDAVLTESLLSINEPVKVMIAGLGHVRNDRGLPLYLVNNLEIPSNILAIGMIEVDPDKSDPLAYADTLNSDTLPFDIVIFTPKVDHSDQCAELEKHFMKKTKKKPDQ
ncbi:MAG: ChaN family lipoprotein [Pseudomonadota bacterium]|nr:ChaN family lipoprotein [Pseudomonadota bacterium]